MMPTTPTRTPTSTTPASDAALGRALDPVRAEEFLADYWEQKPLHVARAEAGRFDDLLSARDVERMVSEPGLRYPGFRLVKAGTKLDVRDYTEEIAWRPVPFSGAARPERVLAEFEGGATIVLQGLHHTWTPLAAFSRELEARLGQAAQVNAYCTPRRSQGLPVHHDTHDVLVLQVAGEKRWLVYEPVLELPLKNQRYSQELGGPGDSVLDVTLRPGDTLYLPRGWLHEALTSESDSLHLTVGLNVVTWLDAFRAAVDRCAADLEFRRSVPPDGTGGDELLERLAQRLEAGEVSAALRERFLASRRPILDGQLGQLRALESITEEAVVERRPTVLADFDGKRLRFEGKTISFPAHAREELDALVEAREPVRVADLPGLLDGAGRLVLVRRLVREGFLRVAR